MNETMSELEFIMQHRDLSKLPESERELLKKYDDFSDKMKVPENGRKVSMTESVQNYQRAMVVGMKNALKRADGLIEVASKDIADKKYLKALEQNIDGLKHLRAKGCLWEHRDVIDDKIKELIALQAKIDL
jgi:predicted HAD superfamily phosphohydrolase